jgi:O-acetyl-ADP-ribose deacetylase (regulator of RNase III)
MTKLQTVKADITTLSVDAVINAANSSLLGGGGVDGAIHRAAGKELLHECRLLGGCKTGDAKITRGYNLPASFIIHTVGPVWNGGTNDESVLLESCYLKSLKLAAERNLASIAFPSISTGIFGYPINEAATIAVTSVRSFISDEPSSFSDVTFCCYSDDDLAVYQELVK